MKKMILSRMDENFNNGVSQVKPPNERSIKFTESAHNTFNQKQYSLLGSKFGSGSAKAVSQGDVTKAVHVILHHPCKDKKATDR